MLTRASISMDGLDITINLFNSQVVTPSKDKMWLILGLTKPLPGVILVLLYFCLFFPPKPSIAKEKFTWPRWALAENRLR